MKLISVVTPCYNEEVNVEEIHKQVKAIFAEIPNYRYEHIFIDNASTDNTVAILRTIAEQDPHTKIIVNARNFGHIRSPYHAILETNGDATILIVADLQDPPAMIKEFIKKWEQGYKMVVGVKPESQESKLMFTIRRAYYNFVTRIADVKLIKNFTGFGLYDKEVVDILRTYKDPYPYFRGLIAEIGLEIAEVPYNQPRRARGVTKNNFYSLYDMAMLGITSHSKLPLRLATMAGFSLSLLSFIMSCYFFYFKITFLE